MIDKGARRLTPVLWLAAATAVNAQDAETVLEPVSQAMSAENVTMLRFTAAGSGYRPAEGDSPRQYFRILSYTEELDLGVPEAHISMTPADTAPAEAASPETRTVTADSPWPQQYELWTNPYGFLQGALAGDSSVGRQTVSGTEYQVVSFMAGGHEVTGFLDDQHLPVKVQTEFDDPAGGTTKVEASYRDWMDFGGIKFPTIIIQKQNGELARVLVVSEVETGPAPSSA